MLATFSNEKEIETKLEELDCKLVHFANGPARGVVGRTRLTEALLGGRSLEGEVAQQLLTLLDEMSALKKDLPTPPDWSDADRIRELLEVRRIGRNGTLEVLKNTGVEGLNLD